MNRSEFFYVKNYGESILQPLPNNALLLVNGDLVSNIPFYLQICEGVRQDVDIVSISLMTYEWFDTMQKGCYKKGSIVFPGSVYHPFIKGGYSMEAFLNANYGKREIFLAGNWKERDTSFMRHYSTLPFGMLQKIIKTAEETSVNTLQYLEKVKHAIPSYSLPPVELLEEGAWEKVVITDYYYSYHQEAYQQLLHARSKLYLDSFKKSRDVYEWLVSVHPEPPNYIFLNLALAYDGLRNWEGQSAKDKMIENFEKYLNATPNETEEKAKIRTLVAEFQKEKQSTK
jgi:hypothetical protein